MKTRGLGPRSTFGWDQIIVDPLDQPAQGQGKMQPLTSPTVNVKSSGTEPSWQKKMCRVRGAYFLLATGAIRRRPACTAYQPLENQQPRPACCASPAQARQAA